MVEATGLKVWLGGHLQWHDLPIEFYEHILISSKLLGDTQVNKRTDRIMISWLTFSFEESMLKTINVTSSGKTVTPILA
jgi:hypothetical protein